MAFKISQNHEICIGCGACAAIAPSDWTMNGDKADLIGGKKEGKLIVKVVKDASASKDAANACPVKCIKVEESK